MPGKVLSWEVDYILALVDNVKKQQPLFTSHIYL